MAPDCDAAAIPGCGSSPDISAERGNGVSRSPSLPAGERQGGTDVVYIHERLSAVQSELVALQGQLQALQEQQASIVSSVTAAKDAVLARMESLLSLPV